MENEIVIRVAVLSVETKPFDMNTINESHQWQTRETIAGWRLFLTRLALPCILLTFALASSSGQTSEMLFRRDSCQRIPTVPIVSAAQSKMALQAAPRPMVRVAYVIPSNRSPQPDGVANLQHVVKTGQQFFKDQMEQNGFGPKTFTYETEADGVTPLIHVVHVTETDDYLRDDLWGRTSQAAMNAGVTLWAQGEVWILVPEAHLMQPDGTVLGGVALGASFGTGDLPGVSMIGSNAIPLFKPDMITNDTPYDGNILPSIGPYPMRQDVTFPWFEGRTYSSLASSWYGALWHETGHAFGLAHDFRNDNNFHGNLMGNGLRGTRGSLYPDRYSQDYTRLEYASALILNVSHFFNHDKIVTALPFVSIRSQGTLTPQNGLLQVAFVATDDDTLSLAHLRYNGETVAEMRLHGATVDTLFSIPNYAVGDNNQYTVAVHDKQGNVSYTNFQATVSGVTNRAPFPFFRIEPPAPRAGQSITFNASQSWDLDNDISSVLVSWDLNNDGIFDTQPGTNKMLQYMYATPGRYLIRVKLTDPSGAVTISTPISITIQGGDTIGVESFTLINATDDLEVGELKQGDVIEGQSWIGKTFSVRANTTDPFTDKVEFELNGPIEHQQTESVSPYALFGDDAKGDYWGKALLPGEYTLTARPYAGYDSGASMTISFKVTLPAISFTLINAWTDREIRPLTNDDTIRLTDPGMKLLDVRADALSDNISSVVFELDGPVRHYQTEREYPYALFGDLSGNYNGRTLVPGSYTLTATSYRQQMQLATATVSFIVTNGFDVVGFTLIDATTDQAVGTLVENEVIDLAQFHHHKLAIRADTEPGQVEKVDLLLQGPVHYFSTERVYPYALFGDIPINASNTDYTGGQLRAGKYTLSATPYWHGTQGTTSSINFEVVNGRYTCGRIQVYPIPATDVLNIAHEGVEGTMNVTILDANGNVLINQPLTQPAIDQLDVRGYRGTHYLKIFSEEGNETIRFVIRP